MTKIRRTDSLCTQCPLNDKPRVYGVYPSRGDVPIVFVGEAPGAQETYQHHPFVGPAGIWLSKALVRAGIMRHQCGLTNIIYCQPPGNNIHSWEAQKAIECCKPGFEHEVNYWKKRNVKVIVPLGNTALQAFGIDLRISDARGSVFQWRDFIVIPTYHPSYIMRGQVKEEGTWIADLIKAKDIAEHGYTPIKENFILNPTVEDVRQFVEDAITNKKLIGVDLETTSLNPYSSKIVVIGLASSGSDGLSVPLLSGSGINYWDDSSYPIILSLLRRFFSSAHLMFQNALYDVRHLEIAGFKVKHIDHDILLAHHAIHPELPHNLGYIVSIYGQTPYWKEPFKTRTTSILDMNQHVLREYNLRDAVVLHQVLPGLLADLKELGTYKVYKDISMPLLRPVMEMMNTGLKLSPSRLAKWRSDLKKQLDNITAELRKIADLPDEFNLASGDHVKYLFYGQFPKSHAKLIKEYEAYQKPDTRKKKNTKKYREIETRVKAIQLTTPLVLPKSLIIPHTLKGGLSIDNEARLKIRATALKRLREIRQMKRDKDKREGERKGLEKIVKVVELYDKYQELTKLWSTYTNFRTERDGRVHFPYRIHGTATGRLASGDKKGYGVGNAQNIPSEARRVFVAEDGFVFISGDYINLELVLIALLSNDDVLLDVFRKGKNAHDENTRMLFGINKKNPNWKVYRKAAKIYRFAMNYGSSVENAYRNVVLNVPEFNLSLAEFKALDKKYMELHPAYKDWYENIRKTVLSKRMLTNGLGRVRIFLGHEHDIVKQALDFGPQSTGADILNEALVDLYNMLHKKKMNTRIVLSVHDSIMIEAPMEEVDEAKKLLKKAMTRTYTINGTKWTFKAEYSMGTSWGELEDIEI